MSLSRRQAIKRGLGTLASLVSVPFVSGCGGGGSKGTSGGAGGGSRPKPYVPPINAPSYPFSSFLDGKITDRAMEVVSINDAVHKKSYQARCLNPLRGEISLVVSNPTDSKAGLLIASDSKDYFDVKRTYFPRIVEINSSKSQPQAVTDVLLQAVADGFRKFSRPTFLSRFVDYAGNASLLEQGEIPEGMVYIGSLTFEDLKKYSKIAKTSTMALVMIAPNQATASAYGVARYAKSAIDTIDDTVDDLNDFFNLKIDKRKRFYFFMESNLNSGAIKPFQFPVLYVSTTAPPGLRKVRMRNLFPIQSGNYWKYFSGSHKASMRTEERPAGVFGKPHTALIVGNSEGYVGFDGEKMLNIGFLLGKYGEFAYEPAILMGDEDMYPGKVVNVFSKLVSLKGQNLEGEIKGVHKVIDRTVYSGGGYRFEDAFLIEVNDFAHIRNKSNGKQVFRNVRDYMEIYVPGVGYVGEKTGDTFWFLSDFGVRKSGASEAGSEFLDAPFPLNKHVISAVREAIS